MQNILLANQFWNCWANQVDPLSTVACVGKTRYHGGVDEQKYGQIEAWRSCASAKLHSLLEIRSWSHMQWQKMGHTWAHRWELTCFLKILLLPWIKLKEAVRKSLQELKLMKQSNGSSWGNAEMQHWRPSRTKLHKHIRQDKCTEDPAAGWSDGLDVFLRFFQTFFPYNLSLKSFT